MMFFAFYMAVLLAHASAASVKPSWLTGDLVYEGTLAARQSLKHKCKTSGRQCEFFVFCDSSALFTRFHLALHGWKPLKCSSELRYMKGKRERCTAGFKKTVKKGSTVTVRTMSSGYVALAMYDALPSCKRRCSKLSYRECREGSSPTLAPPPPPPATPAPPTAAPPTPSPPVFEDFEDAPAVFGTCPTTNDTSTTGAYSLQVQGQCPFAVANSHPASVAFAFKPNAGNLVAQIAASTSEQLHFVFSSTYVEVSYPKGGKFRKDVDFGSWSSANIRFDWVASSAVIAFGNDAGTTCQLDSSSFPDVQKMVFLGVGFVDDLSVE
ncbi:hypothetical protein DIPPA_60713 [Diplonema papillatum]|nr:hypothetical protein DIPPA_60713 [Diplonema papillatum]